MTRRKILRHIFRFHGLRESLGFAARGIIYLFLFHRNMRLIFICGVGALIAGVLAKLKGLELVALSITVALVFMAEIFNTAIEMLMNMITVKYHLRIKLVKDIAAAVVLITCINAVVVGYILFRNKLFTGR
ncbi:MAG: diacylglycerol kinase family protein [Candidatus Omnitrophota bacterium]